MSTLRTAVVGVGALGRHHARILAGMSGVELVAVADTNAGQATAIAEQHQALPVSDFEDLFALDLDAVSIAVPTQFHLQVASRFLERGIPTLVEKPLAPNSRDGRQLVALARQRKTILQVGHVERFNPATEVAWQCCGAPRYIRAERVSPFSFRSTDIGVIHDLMIHDLDLVLDLVRADVLRVQAFGIGVMGGFEDCVQARLTFSNGCIADLTASRISPTAHRTMQVWSDTGCVTVDFTSREVVRYAPSDRLKYGTPPVERALEPGADIAQLREDVFGKFIQVERPPVSTADALTAELQHFADCVRSGSRPVIDGQTALHALEIADTVIASAQEHFWDGQSGGRRGLHPTRPHLHKQAG